MKELNILELGACSLLDFKFPNDINGTDLYWKKTYNVNRPEFYSSCEPQSEITEKDLQDADILIISIGDKGKRINFEDMDFDDIEELLSPNLLKPLYYINLFIRSAKEVKPRLIIYLDSKSSNPDQAYPTHSIYASSKSFMRKLFLNLERELDDNWYFADLIIDSTKSRMTDHGSDPKAVRDAVLNLFERFINNKLYKREVTPIN